MKAAHIITAIRRTVAHWLYEPFATMAWEPSRATTALLPAPAKHATGAYTLPSIIDGVAGGQHWPGPAGTWRAVYLQEPPHRRRDTGILVPPVQNTSPMQRLATRLTPIPETPVVPSWASREAQERRISDALARVDSARLSWLYDDPPVLQPLDSQALASTDRTAASKTTEKPDSALMELAALASQDESDETAEVPAYMRKRAIQLQQQLRESE